MFGLTLLGEFIHAALKLLGRYVFLVGCNPPAVTGRVLDRSATIAVELVRDFHHGGTAGPQGALISGIDVENVQVRVKRRWAGIRLALHRASPSNLQFAPAHA